MPNWRVRFWDKEERRDGGGQPAAQRTDRGASPPSQPQDKRLNHSPASTETDLRLNRLRRRREMILFDVEQAEAALRPDNPWQERAALLTEALETIDADRQALAQEPATPSPALPPTPIIDIDVHPTDEASVAFRIGDERFHYQEAVDWAERGTTVVRGDLRHQAGDPAALVPSGLDAETAERLIAFLTDSLYAFAVDLRDRALRGESSPEHVTLADLAKPCSDCGGWTDWKGICPECQRRNWRRQQLDNEARRLLDERAQELDDLAQWAERLPVARRRLADVDAEIAALGGDGHGDRSVAGQ
jgi:hypothetical protein